MSREAALFLEDIENGCAKIVRYTENRSRFALDQDILWDAIQNDVPKLWDRIRQILAEEVARDRGGSP